MKLTHFQTNRGVWQAHITGTGPEEPRLEIRCGGTKITDASLRPVEGLDAGNWEVEVALPASLISDDGALVSIIDLDSGNVIGMLQIYAGAPIADDPGPELARLREELEVVKEVLRRHLRG